MIDMKELEQAWKGLDQRLEQQALRLDTLQRASALGFARARLRWLTLGQVPQMLIGLFTVLWAGGYWTAHWGEWHLVVCGIAIHLYGIALLGFGVAQGIALAQLDFQSPVLDLQRRLIELARLRIRAERVLLMAGFVVWLPIALVALNSVGVDVWRVSPANVAWNLAASLALMAVVGWLTLRLRAGFERDAVGQQLREAMAALDALESGRE